jgi:hypothetical protein
MKSSISRFPLTRRQTMHRQDGRQKIDRRTLLAKGAAFCGASRHTLRQERISGIRRHES